MGNLNSVSYDVQTDFPTRPLRLMGFSMQVCVAVVIGLAFFWQFFRHANLTNLFGALGMGSAPGVELWVPVYYGVAVVLALIALSHQVQVFLDQRYAGVVFSALATVVSGAFLSLRFFGGMPSEVLVVCGFAAVVLFAFSFIVLAVSWADCCGQLAGFNIKGMVYCVCISSLVSLVISFGLFSLSPIPEIFPVIVPVASALSLMYAKAKIASVSWTGVELQDSREQRGFERGGGRDLWQGIRGKNPAKQIMAPRSLIFVLVALLVVAVCVKGIYDTLVTSTFDTGLYLKHFITIIELAIIMTICLFAVKLEKVAFLGWFVLVGGLVSGLVMISLSGSDLFLQVGLGTITAARTCFEVFIFSLVVVTGKKKRFSRSILLLLIIPETISCLLGYWIIPEIVLIVGFSVLPTVGFISLGLGIAVAVCSFLVAGFFALKGIDAAAGDASGGEVAPRALGQQTKERFERLALEYSLTPREQEIAGYVFRGYSAKRIAELQYLSLNTVQSHTRNLYRKIGIHSRQELIDLLDKEQSDPIAAD